MARLFQFSVRGLLWAVTILAVGIAALLNASDLWQGAIWGLVLFGLTAAVLLVVYRRQESRAFWLGFAVFGWLYLALFLASLLPSQTQFWIRTDPLNHEHLLATRLAHLAHEHLLPASRREPQIAVTPPADPLQPGQAGTPGTGMMPGMMPGAGGPGSMGPGPAFYAMASGGAATMMVPNPDYVPIENFTHIFHALILLLVAAIGGKTCQLIYRTRPTETES